MVYESYGYFAPFLLLLHRIKWTVYLELLCLFIWSQNLFKFFNLMNFLDDCFMSLTLAFFPDYQDLFGYNLSFQLHLDFHESFWLVQDHLIVMLAVFCPFDWCSLKDKIRFLINIFSYRWFKVLIIHSWD